MAGAGAFGNNINDMLVGQPLEMIGYTIVATFKCKCQKTGVLNVIASASQGGFGIGGGRCPGCGRTYAIKRYIQDPKTGLLIFDIDITVMPEQVAAETASPGGLVS